MAFELGVVLLEQQALLSMLVTRFSRSLPANRPATFESSTRALFAHLAAIDTVLLPSLQRTLHIDAVEAAALLVSQVLAGAITHEPELQGPPLAEILLSSMRALFDSEKALLVAVQSDVDHATQALLAVEIEECFTRLTGLSDLQEFRASGASSDTAIAAALALLHSTPLAAEAAPTPDTNLDGAS